MPAHKSQHFVPRVYLAPFSVEGRGSAINLLNIRSGRTIANAPLRNQCARNYLYSPASDMRLEKMLQELEGKYAEAQRTLDDPRAPAIGDIVGYLRMFTFVQHLRTDQAMRARKEIEERLYTSTFEGALGERAPEPTHRDKTDRDFMLDTMRVGMLNSEFTLDLKHCVIDNHSPIDFVTSDDPAVLTNRFLKQKHGHANFGFGSSGAMFVLPMSPRRLFLLYDGGVYTIPDKTNGRLRIRREASVRAFNELQYIRAAENIYFADWQTHAKVVTELDAVKQHRREAWTTVRVLLRDHLDREYKHFRQPLSDQERIDAKEKLIHLRSEFPTSTTWATEIKFRDPVRTFSNGSAMGMVRQREWLTSRKQNEVHESARQRISFEGLR